MAIINICTPAGACPAKLKGTDRDSVVEWGNIVVDHGMKESLKYLTEALIYWVRNFYDFGTKEYKTVCQILVEEFGPVQPWPKFEYEVKKSTTKFIPEKEEEIADIDSFAIGEDEDDDDGDIRIKAKK